MNTAECRELGKKFANDFMSGIVKMKMLENESKGLNIERDVYMNKQGNMNNRLYLKGGE